jgi:uncharacterized RDD family membrane protein YckC
MVQRWVGAVADANLLLLAAAPAWALAWLACPAALVALPNTPLLGYKAFDGRTR